MKFFFRYSLLIFLLITQACSYDDDPTYRTAIVPSDQKTDKKILAIALDADGCVFNGSYTK